MKKPSPDSTTKRSFPKNSASHLSDDVRQVVTPEAVQPISFTWRQIHVGDCTLTDGAELVLFSDGSATWEATVSSSSSDGDVWLATITLYDDHGVQLWQFPQIDSPEMDVAGLGSFWLNDQLHYPAYLFPYISRANLHSHC
jgi:uncharacterized protein DUF6294